MLRPIRHGLDKIVPESNPKVCCYLWCFTAGTRSTHHSLGVMIVNSRVNSTDQLPTVRTFPFRVVHIELLTDIPLSDNARLVPPWPLRAPTWESPSFITCRTFQRFVILSISPGTSSPFSFFFFRFVCVLVLGARHRWRGRRRHGYQRVLVGSGRVARSTIVVFMARQCVCLETRGDRFGLVQVLTFDRTNQQRPPLHRLCLASNVVLFRIEYVQRFTGRSGLQEKIQAVLNLATGIELDEKATQSEHQHCRVGERSPRRAPGFTRGGRRGSREESYTRPDSVAKWSREGRAAYEADREARLLDYLFGPVQGVPIRQTIIT